jgi:RNA polymerase sigma factor (sigma-70 family)
MKGNNEFTARKGVKNVKPNNNEQNKRHAFDSFCKKILKHEARDYYDELKRQRSRETTFSDLSAKEIEQLYMVDKYFATYEIFNVLGLDVIVSDDVIVKALQSLPERKRDIILLSYFLELSDREIGDKLNMLRSTVQYQRAKTLQQLKTFMEGDIYGQQDKK